MAQKADRRPAEDSPKSAARYVRRGAQAIRESGARISQYRAEKQAVVDWATARGRLLPFSYIEQFSFIGDGAEHRVYKSEAAVRVAIKATHCNRFGHSTLEEGKTATPVQYLKRLAWQNYFFGDDIRIIGVCYDEEDQMEIVTSQPWISVHRERPNPTSEEIDIYMGRFGFVSTSFDLDTPLYYSADYGLVVGDATDRNVIRDHEGNLTAIDVVIGPPGEKLRQAIDEFQNGPQLPF